VHRHGSQAPSGAQADAVEGHLIDAVVHRAKASRRCVPWGVHLICQLLHQRLHPVELGVVVYSIAEQWRLVPS
jgi:hypothetical protein